MNMKKKIVTVCLVACMALTAVAGGTLAYFSDATQTETNTFEVGDVKITLDEKAWKPENAKLVPGKQIPKDPTVTLDANSEDAWVFVEVKVGEDLWSLMNATTEEGTKQAKFEAWLGETPIEAGWNCIDSENLVYAYNTALSNKGTKEVTLFNEIKVPTSLDTEMVEAVAGEDFTINVTAKALQKEAATEANIDAYNQVKDLVADAE